MCQSSTEAMKLLRGGAKNIMDGMVSCEVENCLLPKKKFCVTNRQVIKKEDTSHSQKE